MCQPDSQILLDAINSQINTYSLLMNVEEIYHAWYVILVVCPLLSILLVGGYVMVITKIPDMTRIFMGFIVMFIVSLIVFSVYSFTIPYILPYVEPNAFSGTCPTLVS
jgi:uncharacterized membrane protein SpoIIM required for sporulation